MYEPAASGSIANVFVVGPGKTSERKIGSAFGRAIARSCPSEVWLSNAIWKGLLAGAEASFVMNCTPEATSLTALGSIDAWLAGGDDEQPATISDAASTLKMTAPRRATWSPIRDRGNLSGRRGS